MARSGLTGLALGGYSFMLSSSKRRRLGRELRGTFGAGGPQPTVMQRQVVQAARRPLDQVASAAASRSSQHGRWGGRPGRDQGIERVIISALWASNFNDDKVG